MAGDQVAMAAQKRLIEALAAVEHERWAHWQRYLHEKGARQPDGSLLLPADLIAHWEKQISTDYLELTEEAKESDREQVRKSLPAIVTYCDEIRQQSASPDIAAAH